MNKQTLEAKDGYPLVSYQYPAENAVGVIVMAGATGVPQKFYKRFAETANQQGFTVVTFDYRGIGESAPRSLKGFEMDYLDWAFKDLESVIDNVQVDNLPLFLLGHSFGGHALGLLENHQKITAAYFFGTGAGWHGWMPGAEKWRVWSMWNIVGPIITKVYGYLAWDKLGMGENLPLGVYKDWRRWCSYPNYFFDDPEMSHVKALFARIEMPVVAANALDDKWALPQSRDAFVRAYVNADLQVRDINPDELDSKSIGHMGYFRQSAEKLWADVFSWFSQHKDLEA